MSEYAAKFKEITTTQSIDEQVKTFLRAFVSEFQGKFEEVLDIAEQFKTYSNETGKIVELDEFQAHRFLEKRKETATVTELREKLKLIDLDRNNKVAFIEYCLFKYQKSLKDLFTAQPPVHLIAALEKAIDDYRAVFEERKKKQEKISELEKVVAGGGPGAAKAKAELKRLQMENPNEDGKKRNKCFSC